MFRSATASALILVVVGVLSLFAWMGAWRRYRLARDLPTAKIRSAPQGYVELAGTAEPAGPEPLRDPITRETCLWFRVETYQRTSRNDGTWVLIKNAESSRPFVVRDETAACEVFPEGGEFTTGADTRIPDGKDLEHRVARIRSGDPLYVAGRFETVHGAHRIVAPADGRPFLVSTNADAHSGSGYGFMATVHVVFFFIGLAALGWLVAG